MSWRTVLRPNHRKNLGFTAAELVVTVGIMATVAAVSVPLIKQYTPTYNTKLAVRDIVSQMQLARIHAIKNQVTTLLVFYPESFTPAGGVGSFMVFEDDNRNGATDPTDNNWLHDAGERVIVARTYMPAQISLFSAAFTNNGSGDIDTETTTCGFDSQGVAARNGAVYVIGEVQLQNSKNETRKISLQASGKAKITQGS